MFLGPESVYLVERLNYHKPITHRSRGSEIRLLWADTRQNSAPEYRSAVNECPGTQGDARCADDAQGMETIELYTRPGCPFCFTLRRRLRKHQIGFREINIWNDAQARDRVRAAANGNETVPTVHVGDRWLTNPKVKDITAELRRITNDNTSGAIGAAPNTDEPGRPARPFTGFPGTSTMPPIPAKGVPAPRHHVLDLIHATREIIIYRTTVVARGTPGIVAAVHTEPERDTTYTVEFQPNGLAGATIRVGALTAADLQGSGPPQEHKQKSDAFIVRASPHGG